MCRCSSEARQQRDLLMTWTDQRDWRILNKKNCFFCLRDGHYITAPQQYCTRKIKISPSLLHCAQHITSFTKLPSLRPSISRTHPSSRDAIFCVCLLHIHPRAHLLHSRPAATATCASSSAFVSPLHQPRLCLLSPCYALTPHPSSHSPFTLPVHFPLQTLSVVRCGSLVHPTPSARPRP